MDPLTLTLLLAVAGYCVAAPDRRTLTASRGTAGAARSAVAAGARQVRDDWRAARPGREATGRRVRAKLHRNGWGWLSALWDVTRVTGRAARATARGASRVDRVAYRTGRAAAWGARQGYRTGAQLAREKRDTKRAERKRLVLERERQELIRDFGATCYRCGRKWDPDEAGVFGFFYREPHDVRLCPACTSWLDQNYPDGWPDDPREIRPKTPDPTPGAGSTTPTPPTTGESPVLKNLMGGELTTTSDLRGETNELRQITEDLREALERLNQYLIGLGDRYAGAPFGTAKLSKAVTNLGEQAKNVDPVVADHILEQATELEQALTEAENLGEHAESVAAEGEIHAFTAA